MKNPSNLIGSALFAVAIPVAFAAPTEPTNELEEIIVTATRQPQQLSDVLGEVTVITREQIVATGALDLADVLSKQNGLTVVRSGGVGSQTSVFMRGTESDHTLLLVNGVRYNAASDGAAPWADIPLHNIERIEIVRGARSSLYGSDALGGVIQIITKKGDGGELSFTVGSHGTREIGVNLGASSERVSFSVNAKTANATGIDATNENTAPRQLDDDGYSRRTFGGSLVVDIGVADLQVDFQQVRNEQEIDGFGSTEQASEIDGGSVRLVQSDGGLDWSVLLGSSKQEFGSFSGQRDMSELQVSYQADKLSYVVAVGHEETEGEQQFGYSRDFDSSFILVQVGGDFGPLSTQGSIRSDDYSGFGRHTTGNLSLGMDLTEGLKVSGHYGTGFRAPSMNNLFAAGFANDENFNGVVDPEDDTNGDGQFDQAFAGNPDLKPEESEEFSVSLTYMTGVHHWALSAFDIEIENLISFSGTQDNFVRRAANQAMAQSRGLELAWSAQWERYSAGVNATIQRTKDDNGDQQLRRPDESGTAYITYKTGALGAYGIDVFASSGHRDVQNKSPFGKVNTSGYAVFNLSAQWELAHGTLTAKAENIFDKEYEQVVGFSTPGAGGYLSYRLTW